MPHEPTEGVPAKLVQGDTWRWRRTLSDHPPSDGWTLKYQFSQDAGEIELTLTADESQGAYLIDEAPAATQNLTPGLYRYAEFITNDAGDRFTIGRGTIQVEAVHHESTAARMVRVISAAIEEIVTGKKQQVSINSRGHTLISLEDLRRELKHWKAELEQERRPGLGPKFAARMQAPGFVSGDLPFRDYL